jgi:hypothetical protein
MIKTLTSGSQSTVGPDVDESKSPDLLCGFRRQALPVSEQKPAG